MGRTIDDIEVVDVEKRKIPSKHYVYILHVTWSDQCTNVIYRRYSRFFDFQSNLMEMFPEEAGALDPSKRIIPFLPGKKFFGRSHIREVALKRMAPIAEYCKAIVRLPRRISQCKDVIQFFELEPEDIDPPKGRKASVKAKKISQPKPLEVYIAVSDYKKQEKGEVTLKIGMLVEIVEKTETGWWFVNVEDEQGWVPSTCLEREDGHKEDTSIKFGPGEEQQYLCTEEFCAEGEDEISLERGAVVDVLEKNLEGWWLVRYNSQEGYVPATFLIQTESVKVVKKSKSAKMKNGKAKIDLNNRPKTTFESSGGGPQIVKSLHEVSDLLKDDSEPKTVQTFRHTVTPSQVESEDDVFDDDDYEVVDEDEGEKIYTVQELSKILKEGKTGCEETEKVYESIQSMKSRSLTRCGSTRPPPRPSFKPGQGFTPKTPKPPILHSESFNTEYVTIATFNDAVGDGISFREGQPVKILEKNETGWWYVEINNIEGWAPAAYIERVEPTVVEPAVNKQRTPSPKSILEGREDVSRNDTDSGSRSSTVGDLASALKGKLGITAKQPPPPPKKDFLHDSETKEETSSGPTQPGKLNIPSGLALPSQTGVRKGLDREKQPPPPAPPADRAKQPPPPAPPTKTVNEPKPSSFGAALKPVKKFDTKPESKPKPAVPLKHMDKPASDKPKVPVKQPLETMDTKPKPPPKVKEQNHVDNDIASANVQGMTSALKARFSALETDHISSGKPTAFPKPKPPVKQNAPDTASARPASVSGIAGALKAKFEAVDTGRSDSELNRPKSHVNIRTGLKPVPNQNKPTLPQTGKKPGFGSPGVPVKPNITNQSPQTSKPSWVKNHENESPVQDNKPAWARNKTENVRKKSDIEDDSSAHKVSDLANVLKAKFENRSKVSDSSESEIVDRNSKPLPNSKPPLKPFTKPARPSTPPSPRSSPGRKLPNVSSGRSSSPISRGTKNLEPQKYSSRPLPPEPKSPSKLNTADKQSFKPPPVLHKKPQSSIPSVQLNRGESRDSSDSDGESKPAGVSNLANVLKAKLGNAGKSESVSNVSQPTSNQTSKNIGFKIQSNNSDVENNNVKELSHGDNLFCAIADFAGSNPGEIKLMIGQTVELIELADGWSYVGIGGNEGWAPSSYLEKVKPGQVGQPEQWTGSQSTGSKQTVYSVTTEFIAENEGELSVKEGQEVCVLEMPDGGWWFIQAGGNEGWVPAAYIEQS